MDIDKDFCRQMTENSLERELNKIKRHYMMIYDEYYSGHASRDSAFLKDLVDALQGISAVLEVYCEHGMIHPDYAIDKLRNSRTYINCCIAFYESKINE